MKSALKTTTVGLLIGVGCAVAGVGIAAGTLALPSTSRVIYSTGTGSHVDVAEGSVVLSQVRMFAPRQTRWKIQFHAATAWNLGLVSYESYWIHENLSKANLGTESHLYLHLIPCGSLLTMVGAVILLRWVTRRRPRAAFPIETIPSGS